MFTAQFVISGELISMLSIRLLLVHILVVSVTAEKNPEISIPSK